MRRSAVVLSTAGFAICAAIAPFAQSQQAPVFEVASVRLIPDGAKSRLSRQLTDARVDITTPLSWVLFTAFRAEYYEFQISAPSWLSDVWVDIHATMPAGATVAQVPEMLQRLLADRFGLVVHREVRQMDGYVLLVGADGIKMREVEPADELQKEFPPEFSSGGRRLNDNTVETPEGRLRTMSTPRGFRRITSRTMYERTLVPGGGAFFDATRMTMAELAPFLWETMDAPVVDKTGLTGVYQFTVTLPTGAMVERLIRESAQRLGTTLSSSTPTGGASATHAVESLGLKLERQRVPVEVVVVDKMSRTPTEN